MAMLGSHRQKCLGNGEMVGKWLDLAALASGKLTSKHGKITKHGGITSKHHGFKQRTNLDEDRCKHGIELCGIFQHETLGGLSHESVGKWKCKLRII